MASKHELVSVRQAPRVGLVGALALAFVLSGCAPSSTPTASPTPVPTADDSPVAAPDAAPTASAAPEDPTCETIILPSLVDELTSFGWTAKPDVFYAGGAQIEGGLQCTWADYDAAASDNVIIYGWAPMAASEASRLQTELISQGWIREDAADGVYITENPEFAFAVDENGYGLTYLFGDGWVKVSDTKQGLVLIEWPPAG